VPLPLDSSPTLGRRLSERKRTTRVILHESSCQLKKLRPSSTVSFFRDPATLLHIAHPSSHPIDEAFATKHMPDLGHDVKEFKVLHWMLSGWKRLGTKLTSSEFDCGGDKWYVLSGCCRHSHSHNPETHSGGYFSSHVATLPLKITPSPYISIALVRRKRIGTHTPNLH